MRWLREAGSDAQPVAGLHTPLMWLPPKGTVREDERMAQDEEPGEQRPAHGEDRSEGGGRIRPVDGDRLTAARSEATTPSFIYALGRIEPRFPLLSVEKEFAQATGRTNTAGLTDRQALHAVLTQRENRYLARQLCWVFTIEGLDSYILQPRDPADLDLLVESVRPTPRPADVDVIIGARGPIAPPELCNGLMVPVVAFSQIYSFDVDALVKSIPRPQKIAAKDFSAVAEELFHRIRQMADNAGATDEHRALNYLAVRYPVIYSTAADAFGRDSSLTAVEVRPSPLSQTRKIMDTVFSFTNRRTDVTEKFFTRVDVTEQFPFLISKMSSYYDRP
jgi:PatG Domain